MKLNIKVGSYDLSIEEIENELVVSASQDGEVVEEFSLNIDEAKQAQEETQAQSEEIEDGEINQDSESLDVEEEEDLGNEEEVSEKFITFDDFFKKK